MTDRRARSGAGFGAVVLAVLAVGFATRALPLYWSPLPATLDGFRYAALARETIAGGAVPFALIDADELVFTQMLAAAGLVTGVRPLVLAQPLVASSGAAAGLTGVALARRLGGSLGWEPGRVRLAAVGAGLGLAVEGLYVRRTGVPDEEAFSLLLVPLLVIAAHGAIEARGRRRYAWGGAAAAFAAALPPLHNFSSTVAALALTALGVAHLVARPTRARAAGLLGLAGLFWTYFLGYFEVAEWLGLRLTYSGLLRDQPGLFVAWVVALAVGVAWFRGTSRRAQRTALFAPIALLFGVVGVSLARPVFPGTAPVPPVVLALVAPLVVPAALSCWGGPLLVRSRDGEPVRAGPPVLALLVGPLALVLFTLTAALTPDFYGAAQRAQTFLHPAAFALGGVVAAGGLRRWRPSGRVAVAALLLAAALTLPLAYVHLDTGTGPSTFHESEFGAVTFAARYVPGPVASDHRLTRPGPHYYGTGGPSVETVVGPTRTWVTGGAPPGCPVVAQRSWTRPGGGAHFFPVPAERLEPRRYASATAGSDLVYSVGGTTETVVLRPRGGGNGC